MIRFAAALLFATAAHAQTPSHCIALADTGVTRAAFEDPLPEGRVRIHYVGHSTFALRTPGGVTAATDYHGWLGGLVPDIVTMNNAHSTHFTDTPDPAITHVLRGWEGDKRLELPEVIVRNVTTDVRDWAGGIREDGNSIFVFEVAGLCIGHLGHLHHEPDAAQYAALGRVDVLMVPVDGSYTMDVAVMGRVVQRLRSSVVLPMHWFSGRSLEVFLGNMEGSFDIVRPGVSQIDLGLDSLPRRPTIMVLEPSLPE
ncbi:MBL fold metallo-hydrolase [Falsirhodobacter xinxiangensis]|uniref:MBL fold metallo-hydrolase n=1 Tax=Falsirhodobacter xinxiangensis TaxID=2530049 RepID=UPI0010A9AFB2|nr:MBL fold metallo-hydrolase [Rhodobacter xinxiangensis]